MSAATNGRDAWTSARELGSTASRYFANVLADGVGTDQDPSRAYDALRGGIAAMGWLELPPEPQFGGPGAPMLTAEIFYAAGRALVPGPLLDDVVVTPSLLTVLPQPYRSLVESSAPHVMVDVAGSVDASDESPRLRDGSLTGFVRAAPHVTTARSLLVVARHGAGECLVLVRPAHPGVDIRPLASMDRYSAMGQVGFDCSLDSDDVVATGGEARALLATVRALGRLALSAELHGIATQLLDMSVEHALRRVQFGRPIGSFQSVKHMLARMACDVLALGNFVHATADNLPSETDAKSLVCAAVKAHASRVAVQTAALALQVHGGIGFTQEHSLQRYYKRALMLEARYGSPAELDLLIGSRRIGGEPAPA